MPRNLWELGAVPWGRFSEATVRPRYFCVLDSPKEQTRRALVSLTRRLPRAWAEIGHPQQIICGNREGEHPAHASGARKRVRRGHCPRPASTAWGCSRPHRSRGGRGLFGNAGGASAPRCCPGPAQHGQRGPSSIERATRAGRAGQTECRSEPGALANAAAAVNHLAQMISRSRKSVSRGLLPNVPNLTQHPLPALTPFPCPGDAELWKFRKR